MVFAGSLSNEEDEGERDEREGRERGTRERGERERGERVCLSFVVSGTLKCG